MFSCLSEPESAVEEAVNLNDEGYQNYRSINELPSWVFDCTPLNGQPRMVVFTDKMGDKERAAILTSQLAALEAAKMEGIYVSTKTLAQEGEYNFGYAADIKIYYLKEQAPAYLDKLKLDKILHTDMGTVARYAYTEKTTSFNYNLPEKSDDLSQWITKQPEIEGYTLAIGSADRHRSWDNSFAAADESAIANLTVTLFGKLKDIKEMNEFSKNDNNQLSQLETIYVSGEGIIRDIMIVARWADEEEKQFYSLAVVPTPGE